jgi:hypothetical protein
MAIKSRQRFWNLNTRSGALRLTAVDNTATIVGEIWWQQRAISIDLIWG